MVLELLFDTGLREEHDLAPKPGDINPIALCDLLAVCDISKMEDAMTLISSLAFQNPKSLQPFRIRPAPYTKAVWKVFKSYIPQATLLYGLRDFHAYVSEQVQSVRVMKRSYERSVTNALYLGRLMFCFIDIMMCIDYNRRAPHSSVGTPCFKSYMEMRDTIGSFSSFAHEFAELINTIVTKYTKAANVHRYCAYKSINLRKLLSFIVAPKLRKRSAMLVGTAHCGKTHFTQALGVLFDAGALNLNSQHQRDFEIGVCYNRRLVLIDDINSFGFQILGSTMSLLDGSRGICNQKYTKISEGVIFPPTLITANDQNRQVSDNHERDHAKITADSKRLTVILSRINITYLQKQLTPSDLRRFAYGSLDVLAYITTLALKPCMAHSSEMADECLHCIFKQAYDDDKVEGGGGGLRQVLRYIPKTQISMM